jgi:hypothetical protein
MKINGIENLNPDDFDFELQRGGKLVYFEYCISLLVVTLRRPSDAYFVRVGESSVLRGMPFTLISLIGGWWAIPWGPIRTIQCLYTNLGGGKPAPPEVINSMRTGATLSGREA